MTRIPHDSLQEKAILTFRMERSSYLAVFVSAGVLLLGVAVLAMPSSAYGQPKAPSATPVVPSPSPTPSPPVAMPTPPLGSPASVQDSLDDKYTLNVGDQLLFRVVEDRDPSRILVVLDSGEINIPYIGRVKAAGKTCRQLAQEVRPLLEKDYYYQATVMLALDTQTRARGKVYLFGGVAAQGPLDIPPDEVFTLSKAIIRSGGFAAGADRTAVRIERKTQRADGMQKETLTINLVDVFDKGRTDLDPIIQPNDLIVVPQEGRSGSVFISGEVNRPGTIQLPGERKFMASEAILAAGGFKDFADQGKVRIIRKAADGSSQELIVDVKAVLDKGKQDKDMEVLADDRIVVRARLVNF
jgi:protein involved in polysaccharide export with SLBB domain